MFLFHLCVFRDQNLNYLKPTKSQVEPAFKNRKLFLESFKKNKIKNAINSHKNIQKKNKAELVEKIPKNLNQIDPGEIILKILIGIENLNHTYQEKKKKKEFQVEIEMDFQNKLISFKVLDLEVPPFELKKALEIISRPKFSILQNKLKFIEKIKVQKKNFFFRSNSIFREFEKFEIISNPDNSSEIWGVASKDQKKKSLSKIFAYSKESPLTLIKIHTTSYFFQIIALENLKDYINEFSFSFSTSIFFSGIRSKILFPTFSFKTEEPPRHYFLRDYIWLSSPQLVLKEEYFEFFKVLGDRWDHPIGGIHINSLEKNPINFCLLISKDNFTKNKKNFVEMKTPDIILHSRGKFFPDFSNFLIPPWLSFFRGVIELDEVYIDFEKGILPSTLSSDKIKFHLVGQTVNLLSFISQKSPRTYAYFWKNFGYLIKMGVLQKENYLKDFAHLMRFYSTHSRVFPISIADYVTRMKKDQQNIFFLKTKKKINLEGNMGLEKLKKEKVEVILITDNMDEILLRLIEKEQQNVNRKKLKFLNIDDLEIYFISEEKKKSLKNQNPKKLELWYASILGTKILKVFLSGSFNENVSAFSETKLTRPFPSENFPDIYRNSARKKFFFLENSSNVFEISSYNKLIRLLNFFVTSKKNSKFVKQVGTLIWELTYFNYGLELPSNFYFKKRVELILCFLLITLLFTKKTKK